MSGPHHHPPDTGSLEEFQQFGPSQFHTMAKPGILNPKERVQLDIGSPTRIGAMGENMTQENQSNQEFAVAVSHIAEDERSSSVQIVVSKAETRRVHLVHHLGDEVGLAVGQVSQLRFHHVEVADFVGLDDEVAACVGLAHHLDGLEANVAAGSVVVRRGDDGTGKGNGSLWSEDERLRIKGGVGFAEPVAQLPRSVVAVMECLVHEAAVVDE